MDDASNHDSNFISLGKFDCLESKHILERFEKVGVRFRIDVDTSPPGASVYSRFGTKESVEIFFHQDDEKEAGAVMNKLYPV
jgi:hypothetical protein